MNKEKMEEMNKKENQIHIKKLKFQAANQLTYQYSSSLFSILV